MPRRCGGTCRGVDAVDLDPAGVGSLEPGDDSQQRRLARAARAEQRRQRALGDLELDVGERLEVAEMLGQAPYSNHTCSLRGLINVIASNVTSAISASSPEATYAPWRSKFPYRSGTSSVNVCVCPTSLPETTADGAELADRAGGRQHDAIGDAPADRRQRDPPEGLPSAGAERRRGLLLLVADLLQHRRDLAHDERHDHEHRREHHPGTENITRCRARRASRRPAR